MRQPWSQALAWVSPFWGLYAEGAQNTRPDDPRAQMLYGMNANSALDHAYVGPMRTLVSSSPNQETQLAPNLRERAREKSEQLPSSAKSVTYRLAPARATLRRIMP